MRERETGQDSWLWFLLVCLIFILIKLNLGIQHGQSCGADTDLCVSGAECVAIGTNPMEHVCLCKAFVYTPDTATGKCSEYITSFTSIYSVQSPPWEHQTR